MNKLKSNLFKISIAILGIICLALPFCFSNTEQAYAEDTFAINLNGAGSSSNPYQIGNATDLKNFAIYVNNGNSTSGLYFELTSNIDLTSESNWRPIGWDSSNSSKYFSGNFNGNGYTISNMKITIIEPYYAGLFGYIGSNATITNFEMENVDIYGLVSSTYYVGSVLGYCASGTVEISKVFVSSGEIDVSSSNGSPLYIGGILGCSINSNLVIKQCWTNVEIANTTINKGSIWYGNASSVIDCYSLQNLQIGNNNLLIKYSYYYNFSNQSFTYYTDSNSNERTYTVYSPEEAYNYLRTKSLNWFLDGTNLLLKNVGNVYTLTQADISVVERYFDVSTNSWQNLSSETKTLNLNSTISQTFGSNTNANYSSKYLSEFTSAYFDFVYGATDITITTPSFTCTTTYLEYAEAGYILYINYTNGIMFNIDTEKYWICTTNDKIYVLTETTSTELTINNLPTQENKYFLGLSTQNTSSVGEWNGTGWYKDVDLLVETERLGLGNTPIDYTITSVDFSPLINYDFSGYSLTNPFTIYTVWGSDNIRANTAVYKYLNGIYTKITNFHIFCDTATTTADYISIEKNQAYTFSIRNSLNLILDTSRVGYQIAWYIGTITDNAISQLSGSEYGALSETTLATSELSNTTTETDILVVLIPRTDIGIDILTNDFEGKENLTFSLNNVEFTTLTTLTYGEVYTITVSNIPNGYYLNGATAQSGLITTFDVNSQTATIIFTVDFNQDITITLSIQESIFNNIYFYLFIAMAITALAIVLSLPIFNKKPKGEK